MFDFGSFRKGFVQAEQRQEAKRAKNAQLYNDFVRNNPDATVDQRSKFAEDLAGGSEYYRSILPTRQTMQTNVDRRQAEVAEAERARKQRAMLDQMTIMSKGADLLSPYYISGNADEGMTFLTDQFGGMITDQMAPYIQNVAKQKAQAEVDKIINARIDTWQAAGANKNDVEGLFNGFGEDLTDGTRTRVNGILNGLKTKAKTSFENELNQAAKSGDAEVFQSVIDKTDTMYPNLDPDTKAKVIADLKPIMDKAEEDRQDDINSKKIAIKNLAIQQMAENKMISEEEVREFMEAQYKLNKIDEDIDETELKDIVKKQQQFRVQVLDQKEEENLNQIKTNNENMRGVPTLGDEAQDLNKAIEAISKTAAVDGQSEDENKEAEKLLQANLRKALDETASTYGINLSDPAIAAAMANAINQARLVSGWQGVQIDPLSIKAAVNSVMSGLATGSSTQALERASYAKALQEMGITTLEELPNEKAAQFRETFKKQRMAMYDEMFDAIDPEIANLNMLENEVNSAVEKATKDMDTMFTGTNSMFEQNRKILDIELSEMVGDTTVIDHYRQRTQEFERIYKLDQELSKLEKTEQAYLKTLAEGGFFSPSTAEQAARIRAGITKIKEQRARLRTEGQKLIEQYNQIEARIAASKQTALEGNEDGSNNNTLIEDAIIKIGLNQGTMTPELLEIAINKAAEEIVSSNAKEVGNAFFMGTAGAVTLAQQKQKDIAAVADQIRNGLQGN